jgi:RNA processing factor Prp31
LSLKFTLKLKSILNLAKNKRYFIKLISVLGIIDKEANKLLNFVKEVYLFKFKEKRTLLINLLYNLTLSNLKKFRESFKQIFS